MRPETASKKLTVITAKFNSSKTKIDAAIDRIHTRANQTITKLDTELVNLEKSYQDRVQKLRAKCSHQLVQNGSKAVCRACGTVVE
jgi:Asp/Glu/hydantoin racemase